MSVRATPSASVTTESPKNSLLLGSGILAPLLFAVVFTIDGIATPGYSAADEAISYLDLGPHGWIQRANFILLGLLLLIFQRAYMQRMRTIFGRKRLIVTSIFFILSDLGWIMAGLFIPNPFLAPQVAWPGILHQFSVIVAFLPFAIACFILGSKAVLTHRWRIYGVYSLILVLPLVFFSYGTIAYLINQNMFGNVNSPGSGTMNRIGLLVGPLAWYAISALLTIFHAPQKTEVSQHLEE